MRRAASIFLMIVLAAGCSDAPDADGSRAGWLRVLALKREADQKRLPEARRAYAHALAAFVQQHPDHSRATDVYRRAQLESAADLAAAGRHDEAVRAYREILGRFPSDADARRGLQEATARLVVSRAKLLELEQGMPQQAVANILGKPAPGWTSRHERRGVAIESWYYRTDRGDVAGVHFRDGRLFAADEQSNQPIASER